MDVAPAFDSPTGQPVWNVLIVEDDALVRAFFADSVRQCSGLHLSGAVASVAEAQAAIQDLSTALDVLLVDLGLPDGSGLDVIRLARQWRPMCESMVVSMFGDDANVLASIEAGAMGYIHKDAQPDDIAHTIMALKAGASPISPMIARRILAKYRNLQMQNTSKLQAADVCAKESELKVSSREQEVLELISRGFSYNEIAALQAVTVHTVRTHIKSLYSKLSVHSRGEAVFEATKLGLLPHMKEQSS
ncbi:MAG: response regulator [Limnohabitans sp.]